MKNENDKSPVTDKLSDSHGAIMEKSSTPIHNTSGGEMPDPNRMPSKTEFHLESEEKD